MREQGLAVYGQFDTMQRAALALHESGFFKDSVNKAQAIVKVMAGAELGLPPFASMSGIHIVQGKPVLGANVIATLVKNDPRYNYKIVECTDKICTIEWFENGQSTGQSSFTMSEAQNAGLTGKDNWKKYPSDMLFARAISRGARRHAPGIFGGSPVYTPDELNVDTDEEGYINGEHTVVVDQPPTPSNNGHNLVDEAVDMGGVVKSETSHKAYNGKTVKIHANEYPQAWGKVVTAFVPKKIDNVPHLDGILQKLELTFDTPVDDVIASVNDYIKQKEN